ncbi:hypothetical protein PMI39_008905 [Pantoea sp. YR343]|uniref:hypothetical protein n=1 Tax=Pantoea sp. YR343 TaxID=1144341 RepID=UPI000270E831|nr:hypothetical protein [Pantoea sp. YR343]KAJ9432440.1 hypothetical protein PMI39_008905 [Pantoea sp. YR343]
MTKIKMLMIDGVMNAVDLETGEIVNHSFPVLPEAYNVAPAVESVLFGDADYKPLLSTTVIKTETRGRKAKVNTNPYASVFANMAYDEDTGRCSLGVKMDDLLRSVAHTAHYSSHIPVKQLAFVMKSEELSTESIMEQINKRRFIQGEKGISERYARVLRKAAEILIRRLGEPESAGAIQLNSGMAFCFEADSVAHKISDGLPNAVMCPVEFTEGDKEVLRGLALAHKDVEAQAYVNQVTEQSGRMLERIIAIKLPAECEVLKAIDNEFPFAPYEQEEVFQDADDEWIDSVVNKKEKQSDDEPEWWIKPIQVSTYTNEAGEPW